LRITPIDFSQNLLFAVAKNPMARVLDHAKIAGNVEQTVSMISEATKLDLETVESALQQLTRLGLAQPTKKIGNMQAYKFNLENKFHSRLGLTSQLQTSSRRRG
jgi:predicted transcriptional regulator